MLDKAYEASKATARHKKLLGKGSGFSYEGSPYCSYAARNGVHVLFMGEVAEWPGVNAVSAAHDGESSSSRLVVHPSGMGLQPTPCMQIVCPITTHPPAPGPAVYLPAFV